MKSKIILCCAAILLSLNIFSSTSIKGRMDRIELEGTLVPSRGLEANPKGFLGNDRLTVSFGEAAGNVTIRVEAEDGTLVEKRLNVEGQEEVAFELKTNKRGLQSYTIEISSEEGAVYGSFIQ